MSRAIVVDSAGKKFRRYHHTRPDTFIEAFTQGFRRLRAAEMFWGLRDVSFAVERGQTLGIIGHNGAGKSTLLRMLGLVSKPDEGTVTVNGTIGGFLDLTAGFQDELTGRENVFVSGVISGLTRREVSERFDKITAFAEIGDFIDSPLRTYSSGMRMRLAFAVAAHTNPDILLIDEVLTVGDLDFRRKCSERIEQFRSDGTTIVIVSHSMSEIVKLCTDVLWLEGGRVKAMGEPRRVLKEYHAHAGSREATGKQALNPKQSALLMPPASERKGTQQVTISRVQMSLPVENSEPTLVSGEPLSIQLEYLVKEAARTPRVQVSVVDERMRLCSRTSSYISDTELTAAGSGTISLTFTRLDLTPGRYFINIGLYSHDWETTYDLHWRLYPLTITGMGNGAGILNPPLHWERSPVAEAQAV